MERDLSLCPGNHSLLLIDYQYLQLLTTRSQNPASIISHVVTLSRSARLFNVPTLITTAFAEQQDLIGEIAKLFPDQVPVDRNSLNAMEDQYVSDWISNTGKRELVMAGLWTEVCLQLSVLKALEEGYKVYIITDASGGASGDAHQKAIDRMVTAGAIPLTTMLYVKLNAGEKDVSALFEESGQGWNMQLRSYLLSRQVYADCI